jgi:hypothetical protein
MNHYFFGNQSDNFILNNLPQEEEEANEEKVG